MDDVTISREYYREILAQCDGLLEALKEIIMYAENKTLYTAGNHAIKQAISAIAKAEGTA